jgi:hypothetical protein
MRGATVLTPTVGTRVGHTGQHSFRSSRSKFANRRISHASASVHCLESFAREGVAGDLRELTGPSRIPPLGPGTAELLVALALTDPPSEAGRCSRGECGRYLPLPRVARLAATACSLTRCTRSRSPKTPPSTLSSTRMRRFRKGVVTEALGVRGARMSCEIWARGSTRIRRNMVFLTKMPHARRTG